MDQHVARWLDEAKDSRTAHAITVAAPTYNAIQCCVTILHLSRQRNQRTAAYIAPTTLPATGEPTQRRNAPARARRLRAAPVGNGCAQHSRVFAGSVHSQLAMSRTPVSQGWSAATVGSRADTEPSRREPDDRGGLADDRENAVASPPKKWKQRRRSHRTSAH